MVILDTLKWSTTLDESFQPEPYPSLAHGHFDGADEDTARRTPGLANVRISGQTDRRRLPESGLRARRPVVGYILNQCHMTVRPPALYFTAFNVS
jgi:hypothetical protein